MKKLLVFLCAISLVVGMAGAASAVLVDFTYTADNVVNSWYQVDGGVVTLSTDSNAADWENADTATLDLDIGTAYEIIWQCENSDPYTNMVYNPGGFLAEISSSNPLIVDSLLSSSAWYVAFQEDSLYEPSTGAEFTALPWTGATEWAPNDGSNIWSPVSGIDSLAQWIWTEANFDDEGAPWVGDSVFIKVCVEPIQRVPEPATMLLLGTGLIGLAGFSRRRFKK